MCAKSFQLCPALCDPLACSLSGSSVRGIPRQEYWSRLSCPPTGDLADLGIKPASPQSPTLVVRFFTTSATWPHTYRKQNMELHTIVTIILAFIITLYLPLL